MKATFSLDGCYTLTIEGALTPGSDSLVQLEVTHRALPAVLRYDPRDGVPIGPQYQSANGQSLIPTKEVMSVTLKPSHARAIASALLAAATEARS